MALSWNKLYSLTAHGAEKKDVILNKIHNTDAQFTKFLFIYVAKTK